MPPGPPTAITGAIEALGPSGASWHATVNSDDEADQRLRRLLTERTWDEAEGFLAISLRNRGRLREAMELPVSRKTVLRPVLLLELGRAHEAAADFEARARGPLASSPPVIGHVAKNLVFNLTHVATCLAAAGDTTRLARLADTVEVIGLQSLSGRDARLGHYIRGLLYAARKQPAQQRRLASR